MEKLHVIHGPAVKQVKKKLPKLPVKNLSAKLDSLTHVCEVVDLGPQGAQLKVFDEKNVPETERRVRGELKWSGDRLAFQGAIAWSKGPLIGIQFDLGKEFRKELERLMDWRRIAHFCVNFADRDAPWDWPSDLDLWLGTDGPIKVIARRNQDYEWKSLTIALFQHFAEWSRVDGVETGRILSKRDLDYPLWSEDEVVMSYDPTPSEEILRDCKQLLEQISSEVLSEAQQKKIFHLLSFEC